MINENCVNPLSRDTIGGPLHSVSWVINLHQIPEAEKHKQRKILFPSHFEAMVLWTRNWDKHTYSMLDKNLLCIGYGLKRGKWNSLNTHLSRKSLTLLLPNDSLILQITFVAHQNHWNLKWKIWFIRIKVWKTFLNKYFHYEQKVCDNIYHYQGFCNVEIIIENFICYTKASAR